MSQISFASAGRSDQAGTPGVGDQQAEKQRRDQDLAHEQRLGAQLRQIFQRQNTSNALANVRADATLGAVVSSARASAAAALSASSNVHGGKSRGDAQSGSTGLENAAGVIAGARAAINDAELAALREPEHGDLADLVQLDQQAASQQSAIVVNLLV
jgi:hypothetical protein